MRTRWYVAENNATRRHNGPRSDLDPRPDKAAGRNPSSIANSNRRDPELEIFPSKIMAACAKIGALANANVRTNRNLCETENADLFADPNMIAYPKAPREGNVHVRSNDDSAAEACAESAKEEYAEAGGPRDGILKEERADEHPRRFLPARRAPIKIRVVVNGQVHSTSDCTGRTPKCDRELV